MTSTMASALSASTAGAVLQPLSFAVNPSAGSAIQGDGATPRTAQNAPFSSLLENAFPSTQAQSPPPAGSVPDTMEPSLQAPANMVLPADKGTGDGNVFGHLTGNGSGKNLPDAGNDGNGNDGKERSEDALLDGPVQALASNLGQAFMPLAPLPVPLPAQLPSARTGHLDAVPTSARTTELGAPTGSMATYVGLARTLTARSALEAPDPRSLTPAQPIVGVPVASVELGAIEIVTGQPPLTSVTQAVGTAAPAGAQTGPTPAPLAEQLQTTPAQGNAVGQPDPHLVSRPARRATTLKDEASSDAEHSWAPSTLHLNGSGPSTGADLASGSGMPVLASAAATIANLSAPAANFAAAPVTTGPQDFDTLVARLDEAREAAAPGTVRTSLSHHEFGAISLQFRNEDNGLSVTMNSADPAFAGAALTAAASQSASQTPDRHNAPRDGAFPNQQGAAQSQSQSQGQAGAGQQDAHGGTPRHAAQGHATDGRRASASGAAGTESAARTPRQDRYGAGPGNGIYA